MTLNLNPEQREKESRELSLFRSLHKLHHKGVQLDDGIIELMLRFFLVADAIEEGIYEKMSVYFSAINWAQMLMKHNPDLEPEIIYPEAMSLAQRTQRAIRQGL